MRKSSGRGWWRWLYNSVKVLMPLDCTLQKVKVVTFMYAARSLLSCPTLCDPIDGSPPGSSVPGILQARILEWVAISFSNAWKWKVKRESEAAQSCRLLATPWTTANQAPPSMGFSRQEYWSGVPLIFYHNKIIIIKSKALMLVKPGLDVRPAHLLCELGQAT